MGAEPIPLFDYPIFEGKKPETSEIKLTGSVRLPNRETTTIDDVIYVLVRARNVGVNNEKKGKDRILTRVEKFEILGARRVDAAGEVAEALVSEASAYLDSLTDEEGTVDP